MGLRKNSGNIAADDSWAMSRPSLHNSIPSPTLNVVFRLERKIMCNKKKWKTSIPGRQSNTFRYQPESLQSLTIVMENDYFIKFNFAYITRVPLWQTLRPFIFPTFWQVLCQSKIPQKLYLFKLPKSWRFPRKLYQHHRKDLVNLLESPLSLLEVWENLPRGGISVIPTQLR